MHKTSFKLEHKKTSTTLSDHVWKLQKPTKKKLDFNINWEFSKKVKPLALSDKG